jgi:hypothetical protein
MINLKELLIPSKEITIEFPGIEGFEVDVCYLAREELVKIRKGCITQRLNRKTRAMEEVLDEDKFLDRYVEGVLKDWRGLKLKHLSELLLVDLKGQDLEEELPFTLENAKSLMQNSVEFESWLTETVSELENFTSSK